MAAIIERIITPTFDKKGVPHYKSYTSKPDNSCAVCMMVPDRIIPVIFVPGVMGSNFGVKGRNNTQPSQPVWLLDSDWSMLKGWGNPKAGPTKRKELLRTEVTDVFRNGALPDFQLQTEEELLRRGWGEVGFTSYSEGLVWLEETLNDYNDPHTGHRVKLIDQMLEGAIKMEKVTRDEIALTYKYRFPVHAVGYNWLDSNANSAKRLQTKITEFMKFYTDHGFRCEQVIVVTHSMGGLVARHCSENLGMQNKILGIVHGVMPAIGAAAVYRRMKAGTENPDKGTMKSALGGIASEVLGGDAAEMTAVLSSAPGPLQLLPSVEYGMNWLKFYDNKKENPNLSLPKEDPYSEIYTVRGKWWSLCDDQLIDPRDEKKERIEIDWDNFAKLIMEKVKKFLEVDIKSKYHPHTYAFCGIDPANRAYGQITWRDNIQQLGFNDDDRVSHVLDAKEEVKKIGDQRALKIPMDFTRTSKYKLASKSEFYTISDPEESGDGTVPQRSGRAVKDHAKAYFELLRVGHEPAYKNKNGHAQRAALYGIVKIAQRIKEFPGMVYE